MARRDRSTLWRTQNFLRDPKLVEAIVGRADIGKTDTIYDLGAGRGAITNALVSAKPSVINSIIDPAVQHEAMPLIAAMFAARASG